MSRSSNEDAIPELDTDRTTAEVGSEGGSPGDVEIDLDSEVGRGSEAGETWQPAEREEHEVKRDETGIGRRSPESDSRP